MLVPLTPQGSTGAFSVLPHKWTVSFPSLPKHLQTSISVDLSTAKNDCLPAKAVLEDCKQGQVVDLSNHAQSTPLRISALHLRIVDPWLTCGAFARANNLSVLSSPFIELTTIPFETSRVSKDFSFRGAPLPCDMRTATFRFVIMTPGLPPQLRDRISFAIMHKQGALSKSSCVLDGCRHNIPINLNEFASGSNFYIGRLNLDAEDGVDFSSGDGVSRIARIFNALGFNKLYMAAVMDEPSQSSRPTPRHEYDAHKPWDVLDRTLVSMCLPRELRSTLSFLNPTPSVWHTNTTDNDDNINNTNNTNNSGWWEHDAAHNDAVSSTTAIATPIPAKTIESTIAISASTSTEPQTRNESKVGAQLKLRNADALAYVRWVNPAVLFTCE